MTEARGDRPFEAVLFDMDGVLVDTQPWWHEVRSGFARAHGHAWTEDDERACMGGNSREWATVVRDRIGLESLEVEAVEAAVIAGMVERYRDRPAPVIGDAPAVVRRVAARRPVGVASSSPRVVIETAVDALGLRDVLGTIVSSDEVATGKPAPDVYRLAAARLGVDPDRCLVVEDSINGVRAGKAAGMTVVLVPDPVMPAPPDAHGLADHVLASLADLDPDALG